MYFCMNYRPGPHVQYDIYITVTLYITVLSRTELTIEKIIHSLCWPEAVIVLSCWNEIQTKSLIILVLSEQ